MRTAMSASRRSRSSTAFDRASSSASAGYRCRIAARIGGSRSTPTISLAVIRTVPLTPPACAVTARRSAALVAASASA